MDRVYYSESREQRAESRGQNLTRQALQSVSLLQVRTQPSPPPGRVGERSPVSDRQKGGQ